MPKGNHSLQASQPYPPSWIDRFIDWIETLPGSPWQYYLVSSIILVGIFLGVQVSQGAYREQGFYPWHIFLALQPLYPIAVIHFLDKSAVTVLERFKPVLKSELDYQTLLYRLTTLPYRQTWIYTLIGILAYFVLFGPDFFNKSSEALVAYRLQPTFPSRITSSLYLVVLWLTIGVLVYHTVHQLRVIRYLYSEAGVIDPFRPEPLYSLATLTAYTSVLIMLNTYGWLTGILQGTQRVSDFSIISAFGTNAFFLTLSLLIFLWPLWGAHNLLDKEKREALNRNAEMLKETIGEFQDRISRRELEGIDEWNKAISGLQTIHHQIERLPTWPWRPGTFRNLIAAIILPLFLWVIQFLLERFLT